MSLAQRSITSSAYNIAANIVSVAVNFVGSIVLARLLEPEVFGVYAFVLSIVTLTQTLPNFGALGAFMRHPNASEDEEVIRTHFTLVTLFSAVWAVVLGIGALTFAPQNTRWVFGIILSTAFISQLTNTPQAILTRRVQFRRIAILNTVNAVTATAVSIGLAWYGFGLWSLLANNIIFALLKVIVLYGIRPVWRPRFGWYPAMVRYFLGFGSKVFTGSVLGQALDRVDDVWTGAVLGDAALGYYSRAYKFATYPRRALAAPLNKVIAGTYAQLRDDREGLSRAFFWVNALMIRANFWFAGLLALIAPEFIRLVLGAKWLPMLDAFRLMLMYTLLDPIKLMVAFIITTSGAPERIIRARAIQLVVMIIGLLTLGPRWGIMGVALAVDVMLLVGIAILYWEARAFVDFSLWDIFAVPTVAVALGLVIGYAAMTLPGVAGSDGVIVIVKTGSFSSVYVGVLILLERSKALMLLDGLRQLRTGKHAIP